MQLGLQKMHNVKVRKNTATISATLFKAKNNKEKSKSINTKKRWTQKKSAKSEKMQRAKNSTSSIYR